MATEIERKFLVKSDAWREGGPPGEKICQGYLASDRQRAVRVRLKGTKAFLTVKGAGEGIARAEFEYPIPVADAQEMLALCLPSPVEKIRHERHCGSSLWEVDEFRGENAGLVVAEIELEAEDSDFERPDWLGEEVTHDPRYLNTSLAKHPWRKWDENEDLG
ncbi:CYTH domain-containing protein [Haloferula sp. BvORR071]|uniref:CYTH domain-containing protein n=1 Tax=Haloferula sp. BvORR071 TaxID=1396141 RepID=UPI000552D788|nr:CYTH domain-containing protein [Haloferula sp. BvORR071]